MKPTYSNILTFALPSDWIKIHESSITHRISCRTCRISWFAGESALSLGGDVASLQNLVGLAELFPKNCGAEIVSMTCFWFFFFNDMVAIWWKCINHHKSILNSWIYQRIWGNYTQVTCTCVNSVIMHHIGWFGCPIVRDIHLTRSLVHEFCDIWRHGGSTNGRNVLHI